MRTYSFLAAILPYNNTRCEKRSIFLNFLILKLPAPQEEDLARGILEDADAEIEPVPTVDGGHKSEPVLDRSSNIVKAFNEQVGTNFGDVDRVSHRILEDTVPQVAADNASQNAARHSDRQNTRIEHDKALGRVMLGLLKDDTESFKQFSDNASFRRWLADMVCGMVYGGGEKAAKVRPLLTSQCHQSS